jgi:hypothetical protein
MLLLHQHCAPLERQIVIVREVYKHLAPLEPESFGGPSSLRWAFRWPRFNAEPPRTPEYR